MSSSSVKKNTRFVVDLGDVELPALVAERLQADIQSAALAAVAGTVGTSRAEFDITKIGIGGIAGLFLGDLDNPDLATGWPWVDTAQLLVARDHTTVIDAIMRNAFAVAKHLPDGFRTAKPDGATALQAALDTDAIADDVKAIIRKMLDALGQMDMEGTAAAAQQSVTALQRSTAGRPIAERAAIVRNGDGRPDRDTLAAGYPHAAAILEDGASSIYSPDHPFYALLAEARGGTRDDAVGTIADIDTVGAAIGGAAGLFIGGLGAAPGAVAGGGGASAGAVLAAVYDYVSS